MHILYFHQYFSTRQGSTGTRSYEMAQRLIAAGHQVTMVCASYGVAGTGLSGSYQGGRREGDVDGIHVIELELPCSNRDSLLKRTLTFLKYSIRSSVIAARQDCDLVFATSTPLTAAIPGLAGRWFGRRPFVFEVRDLWPELPRAMGVVKNPLILAAMGWLERRAYRNATHCIGLAPGICDGIARQISRDRISMIPNGCDLDFFDPDKARPWRPDGIGQDEFVAVFSGTHGPANGLDAVLDAAAELRRRGRDDIRLLLVGDGKNKPGLVERARREDLANVVFHDSIPKARMPGLLAGADAGMQILANIPAFYYGTSPNKFFDYLASGRPVLCNYPGWVADLIREHGCGLAVPPDDAGAFADALEELADHRDRLPEMAAASRRLAEAEFDRELLGRRFVEALTGQMPTAAAESRSSADVPV